MFWEARGKSKIDQVADQITKYCTGQSVLIKLKTTNKEAPLGGGVKGMIYD